MKSTGIIRRVDDLGRVVIPRELLRVRGITDGCPMEFDDIVLRPYNAARGPLDLLDALSNQFTDLEDEKYAPVMKKLKELKAIIEKGES